MRNPDVLVSSPLGVLAVLIFVAAFFFMLEQTTKAKLFQYIPPLLFIYATPVFLNNFDVIPSDSSVYSGLSAFALPAFIVLMLIKVNVPAVVRVMGKGVLVMLMGTAGVMVGAVVAYFIVHGSLSEDAWKGYGALAGSWIGGTANMAATAEMLGTSDEQFGLAIIADNVVYIVWLPLLLMSRDYADKFHRWARVPGGPNQKHGPRRRSSRRSGPRTDDATVSIYWCNRDWRHLDCNGDSARDCAMDRRG